MTTLGRAIKHARIDRGMAQKTLARHAVLSQKHISQIETDKVQPSFRVVQRIAKALGVSLDELVNSSPG